MNTAPTANVKFTAEQALQLHEWHSRLENIQNEIRIAEGRLKNVQADVTAFASQRAALVDEVHSLAAQQKTLSSQKAELLGDISSHTQSLAETQKAHNHLLQEQEKKHHLLTEREQQVASQEEKVSSIQADLMSERKILAKEQEEVTRARNAFLQAAKLIIWK